MTPPNKGMKLTRPGGGEHGVGALQLIPSVRRLLRGGVESGCVTAPAGQGLCRPNGATRRRSCFDGSASPATDSLAWSSEAETGFEEMVLAGLAPGGASQPLQGRGQIGGRRRATPSRRACWNWVSERRGRAYHLAQQCVGPRGVRKPEGRRRRTSG
jgi:hypothetical protein